MSSLSRVRTIEMLKNYDGLDSNKIRDLYRKNLRLSHLSRNRAPMKGAFQYLAAKHGEDWVNKWVDDTANIVLKHLKDLSITNPSYSYLVEMENFQRNQKGPASPIEQYQFCETINKIVNYSGKDLNKLYDEFNLDNYFQRVQDEIIRSGLTNKISYYDIDFKLAWNELPSSSIRGWPYLEKGEKIDALIYKKFSNEFYLAFESFSNLSELLCTPAVRIQGTPPGELAKLRSINIPSVQFVWFMNGVYKWVKTSLIDWFVLTAWHEPIVRRKTITQMVESAKEQGFVMVSLDYRAFDMCLCSKARLSATKIALSVFKEKEITDKLLEVLTRLYNNQILVGPLKENPINGLITNNLLQSGIPNTQADGSIINRALQYFIADKLGYDLPEKIGLALGDDTGLPVPIEIINKYGGYDNLLSYIKTNILNPIGMNSHDKKAYPSTNLIFLQEVFIPWEGIIGVYSLTRALSSLVYSERFRGEVKGIKNNNALETFSQITILSLSYTNFGPTNLQSACELVIKRWLMVDDALLSLLQWINKFDYSDDKKGEILIRYLIEASGGKDVLVRVLRLKQEDHRGILTFINTSNYSQTFPIVCKMFDIAKDLTPSKKQFSKVYELKTLPVHEVSVESDLMLE